MPTGVAKNGKRQCSPRVERISIACEICGVVRLYTPGQVKVRPHIRFCSRACTAEGQRKSESYTAITCDQCQQVVSKRVDHLTERNYCSPACAAAARRVVGARWRDKTQIKAYMRAYTQANRERLNEQKRTWRARNKDKKRAINMARRAGERMGAFTPAEWEALKAQYAYTCLCCGLQEPEITLEPDHVIPLARGGAHSVSNIQPLCRSCNARKNAKTIEYRPIL